MKDYFRSYSKRGFHIFPLKPRSKFPAIKNNLNLATTELKQIEQWYDKFGTENWGLSLAKSGLIAIDIDHKHGGMEWWAEYIKEHGEPKTLKAVTGSGGLHYVFKAEPGQKYKGKIRPGVDIKHNGYIAIQPSLHPRTKKRYKWSKYAEKFSPLPENLRELCTKSAESPISSPEFVSNIYLKKLVAILKEHSFTYDEWFKAGMAIHSMYPTEEGLSLFLDFTSNASFTAGDLEKARDKWTGFSNNKNDKVTINTLFWLVQEKHGHVPQPTAQEDFEALDHIQSKRLDILVEKQEWLEYGDQWVTYNRDFAVDSFNQKGFAILSDCSQNPFMKVTEDKKGVKIRTMGSAALKDGTREYKYLYYKPLANGTKVLKEKYAWEVWAESNRKHSYNSVVFQDPDFVTDDELNLFNGFHIKGASGKPTATIDLIEQSLCNEEYQKSEWLFNWLAHLIQKPFDRVSTVPVLISQQGTGKGLLMDSIMAPMLGRYYTVIMTANELTAQFNVNLAQKLLTFIDEATWRGNKTEDGILKRFIGSPTITVEEKFGARYEIDNFSRYFIASNNKEAVALEIGNRRYVVMESSNKHANDLAFFKPIVAEIKKGKEVNRFFNWLGDRDISNFDPFEMPHTTDGGAAKVATAGPVAQYWEDILFENPQPVFVAHNGELMLSTSYAYEGFQAFCSEIKTYRKEYTRKKFVEDTRTCLNISRSVDSKQVRFNQDRIRVMSLSPEEALDGFCDTLRLEKPTDFIADDHILDLKAD